MSGNHEYRKNHKRVYKFRGKANHCIFQDVRNCKSVNYEWAWIHDLPVENIWSYASLCKSCHYRYDGVHLKGEKHHKVKLTVGQVKEIRAIYKENSSNTSYVSLAKQFNMHQSTIGEIIRRDI